MGNGNVETETEKLYEREGVEWYREKIVEMANKIENPLILKLIYGFVKSGFEEERAGRK